MRWCEPKRLFGELGGGRRCTVDLRCAGDLLEDRSDVCVGFVRGKCEVTSSLLG